jgi:hypothetical protein
VLVRFFRNGDAHHAGVKVAINELEIKSWEAFLNILNRLPRLNLSTGGIHHVYSLNGQEIRSISKFQNRHSYVVASNMFTRTNYVHLSDSFNDDPEATNNDNNTKQQNPSTNGNLRSSVFGQWRSPPVNGEQMFLLPYSRLNMYESLLLNRTNLTIPYDQWLNEEVTGVLSHYIGNDVITHLYAITKAAFTEVKSFSHLFNILKVADTFIACTTEEFEHSKRNLATVQPAVFFSLMKWPRKPSNGLQTYVPKQGVADAKLSINWM